MIEGTDWYTIIYQPGTSGSFFMYFISKHENFLHYDIEYKVGGYMTERSISAGVDDQTDVIVMHDNPHYTGTNKDPDIKKNTNWYYREIAWLDYIKQFEHIQKNKIIIKPLQHYPTHPQFSFTEVPLELLQSQKHIILHPDDWAWVHNRNKKLTGGDKKLINYLGKPDDWTKANLKLGNFYKEHNCQYVYIDPYKLLTLNDNEYNKLLTFIEEKPLTNWKDIIVEYVNTINLELRLFG